MDLILTLALVTFVLLVGFLLWNRMSTKRHQETGGHPEGNAIGIGGLADPLSGVAEGMRDPDEMRADLDAAAAGGPIPPRPAGRTSYGQGA